MYQKNNSYIFVFLCPPPVYPAAMTHRPLNTISQSATDAPPSAILFLTMNEHQEFTTNGTAPSWFFSLVLLFFLFSFKQNGKFG
jgi:hypothetical protein